MMRRAAMPFALGLVLSLAPSVCAAEKPVSWYRDVTPIFKRSCNGCHNPNKLKGEVDTSTFAGLLKPGKHGANFVAGDPSKSLLISEITGKEPSMPKEGDALNAAEVALVTRWIQEGAKDDTPADAYSTRLKEPPTYGSAPVITSIALSPDGSQLAVSGYHEVFLLNSSDSSVLGRLVGESPRVESVAFSPDGKRLAVAGGAPARFGEIQVWDTSTRSQLHAYRQGSDSVFGVSWSPDGKRLAFGGADKSVRVITSDEGREQMRFDNHSDWVFRTAWLNDGTRLLSGSRDRAMKLINTVNGQFIDDINKLLEPVVSMARHPKEEWAAYGGADGGLRVYRIQENQDRTAGNNDVNLIRDFERQSGTVHAVAFSPDGTLLAAGGSGTEVRVYRTQTGERVATCGGHNGAVFTLAFTKDGTRLLTAGFEGLLRGFDPKNGTLMEVANPVPYDAMKRPAVTQR
jgi:WD40 repeat protein